MFYRGYKVASDWQLYGLAGFKAISFPALSDRQKQVATFALKYVGYPYVWAGEYPEPRTRPTAIRRRAGSIAPGSCST